MKTSLLALSASTLLSFGCLATGQVHSSAQVSAPSLVYISSDVQVVEDYEEPIFYTSNYYWRYDAGVWYRSSYHTGGWIRIGVVPVPIRRIETPTAYVHYHGAARATADARPQQRNDIKAVERDERKDQQEERKEIKAEQKVEQKVEQKDERREVKDERKDAKAEQKADHKPDHKPGKK